MARKPRRLSDPAVSILARFVAAPTDELYGFQLINEAGIPSGTLYPALRMLSERRGYLTCRWEAIDPADEKRPRRRLYRLDGKRAEAARREVAEHAERKYGRPSRNWRPQIS